MITQRHNLNINPDKVLPIVYASQYDTAREIEFSLYDDNEQFEPSGQVYVLLGTEQVEATVNGSIVSFIIPESITEDYGSVLGEVVFQSGGKLGTCNFKLKIDRTKLPYTGDSQETLVNTTLFSNPLQTGLKQPLIETPLAITPDVELGGLVSDEPVDELQEENIGESEEETDIIKTEEENEEEEQNEDGQQDL